MYLSCHTHFFGLQTDMLRYLGDFLAVDEIQLCADPERGHVFTDRLLRARGLHETLFLGSDTMRGTIASPRDLTGQYRCPTSSQSKGRRHDPAACHRIAFRPCVDGRHDGAGHRAFGRAVPGRRSRHGLPADLRRISSKRFTKNAQKFT